ncbi:DMT family transporter [Phenylobacterium sp. J426]|uniref:DMT family transporter n=1 Tax=Phenylobacterium sp. J426 TaxID=2898439 RepID=UPI00215154EC|nr:DMT family transporter [Phenylobacterium sp. J426]
MPGVDGLAKYLSATYSPLMIGWCSFLCAALIVTPVAVRLHGRAIFPQQHLRLHLLRIVFLLASATLYYLAVARIPLADAVSAYFIGPIVASLLAVAVLKERFTATKLLSLALGVAGALVILQPGGGPPEPGLLLAFASGVGFACFQVTTRRIAGGAAPFQTLAFQYLAGVVLLAPQAALNWTTPRPGHLWLFAAMAAIGVATHILAVLAYRRAEASTLAPLSYLELLGSTAIGFIVFRDLPGGPVVLGAALIVGAGMILLPRKPTPAPDLPAA